MSGYVGILNLDGELVNRALLDRMTRSLAFRGPDTHFHAIQFVTCNEPLAVPW